MGRRIRRKSGECRQCGQHRTLDAAGVYCMACHREGRTPNSKLVLRVEKKLRQQEAPKRKKTEAEKEADELAAERMRSHKESTWRLGKSPGSYG